MKRTFRILSVISIIVVASACDKFLDTMPDNRAEINSQSKIQALLTSAYPSTDYMLLTEFMSDNVDDYGSNNPYPDRFMSPLAGAYGKYPNLRKWTIGVNLSF